MGRAGRDGIAASCVTLVSGEDLPLLRSMIHGGTPSPDAVLGLLRVVFGENEDQADFSLYDISQVWKGVGGWSEWRGDGRGRCGGRDVSFPDLASIVIPFAPKARALLADVLGLSLLCYGMMLLMAGETMKQKHFDSAAMCLLLLRNSVRQRGAFHRLVTFYTTNFQTVQADAMSSSYRLYRHGLGDDIHPCSSLLPDNRIGSDQVGSHREAESYHIARYRTFDESPKTCTIM